jgi:hypothetical protein
MSAVPVLQEVAQVGCTDCADARAFSSIRALAFVAGDRVIVADADEPKIRILGTDGTVRTAFGREGRGPGEMVSPLHVSAHSDGRIQVIDVGTQRLSVFGADGRFLHSFPTHGFPIGAGFHPMSGTLYVVTTSMVRSRVDVWGAQDTMPRPVLPRLGEFPPTEPGHPPAVHPAVAPDGSFALGDGVMEYRIRVFAADGSRLRDIMRPLDRARKSAREIADERQATARRMGRMGVDARPVGAVPEPDPLRPHFDRRDALAFDTDGRLWVRTTRGAGGTTIFDLFDRTGRFLGEVTLKQEVGLFVLGAGQLAGVTRGADDVPVITIWRISAQ